MRGRTLNFNRKCLLRRAKWVLRKCYKETHFIVKLHKQQCAQSICCSIEFPRNGWNSANTQPKGLVYSIYENSPAHTMAGPIVLLNVYFALGSSCVHDRTIIESKPTKYILWAQTIQPDGYSMRLSDCWRPLNNTETNWINAECFKRIVYCVCSIYYVFNSAA